MEQGRNQERAKGAEASPLAKSKLRKNIKISNSFDRFCVSVI